MSPRSASGVVALASIVAGMSPAHAAQADAARIALCVSCHGEGGNSALPGTPSIAAQPKLFLETQLILFREGVRKSPVMQPVVKGLSDGEISALAAHFAASPVQAMGGKADPALAKRGLALAQKGQCGSCHGADLRGREQIPRIAGQREDYLADAMIAYRDNKRSGGDTTMTAVLYGVPDADIRAMAHYLARED